MSKTRKILSVVLALAMVFATLAVSASAAYYYEDETSATENTQVWTLGTPVDTGDGVTYTVDVSLKTNYPTGAIQFVVNNTDNVNVALTGVTVGSAIPATYNATATCLNSTGKVIIVPQTALNSDSITATAIDGIIATLTYTYSGTGGATINIEEAPKSSTDTDGSLMAARISDGDLVTGDLITGQTATFVTNEQTIGSTMVPATLAVKSGVTGVVIDSAKTFGGAYAGVVYGFAQANLNTFFLNKNYLNNSLEATNNGTLTLCKPNGATSGTGWGTGSTVEVINSNGTTTGLKYVVIIFGDVSGDGKINLNDVGLAAGVTTSTAMINRLAANCNPSKVANINYNVQNNDIMKIYDASSSGLLEQSTLASNHSVATHTNYK